MAIDTAVFFYAPNIIGYVRLILLVVAFVCYDIPGYFLLAYGTFAVLDGIDGYVARKLKQISRFGSLLDVVVDNIGRGMLWCHLGTYYYMVSVVEWLTLVCTHDSDPQWKVLQDKGQHPWFVQSVMDKGFKTPMGVFAIAGLHVLPIGLYMKRHSLLQTMLGLSPFQEALIVFILVCGRLLCLSVELHFICSHIRKLCTKETQQSS